MAESKFKSLYEKLGFLRDYSSLVVPVIIFLVGVVIFIPTHIMSSNLKEEIKKESVSLRGQRIRSLLGTAVAREQWKTEQEYQDAYEHDANTIAILSKQSSQRELLNYKIFPEPKGSSSLIFEEFGQSFRKGIDELIASVNGRDCPTEAELGKHLGRSVSGRYERSSSIQLDERDALIVDEICRARAASSSVYINPSDLSGYGFWDDYRFDVSIEKSVEDCWYWQLGYWITEDVINSIGSMNSGGGGVLKSGVKRLVSLYFSTGDDEERPSYVTEGGGMTKSCTGRFCNEEIDVVHFYVSFIVSNKSVSPFMQELCSSRSHKFRGFSGDGPEQSYRHNQITILRIDLESIDRKEEFHERYRYGEDAVFKMDLICEYIFDKSGYDEIKPESVKEVTGFVNKALPGGQKTTGMTR